MGARNQNTSTILSILNKSIKNTKKHVHKHDQASLQLQRNLKLALHQLSENSAQLKANP